MRVLQTLALLAGPVVGLRSLRVGWMPPQHQSIYLAGGQGAINSDYSDESMYGMGFDFGTSGVRATVIDNHGTVSFETALRWTTPDDPAEWLRASDVLMMDIPETLRRNIYRICISGTSASCLLVNAEEPTMVTRGPRMYGYNTLAELPLLSTKALRILKGVAPEKHTTLSGTSALMKLLCWHLESPVSSEELFAHQADYISTYISGSRGVGSVVSDWNNALKAGYDVEELRWPKWLLDNPIGQELEHCLPKVVMPGGEIGRMSPELANKYGFPEECKVVGGTTDSIAAFLAAGVTEPGHAVTSLGSTLAVKMLSKTRVEDASLGVYSHRLGEAGRASDRQGPGLWLVGGASNVGCAVLREEAFEVDELETLSAQINHEEDSPLGSVYYPLPRGSGGERFPTNDPSKEQVLNPKPESRVGYLHSILESIARVEKRGYTALEALGATKLQRVATAGGGAANPTWNLLRERILGVPTGRAIKTDAAYGCALLAMQGHGSEDSM